MLNMRGESALGCLYIDELVPGRSDSSGPSVFIEADGEAREIEAPVRGELWGRLQNALQAVRARCDVCAILARGTGCAAALALAEQLPVDRLVLYEPCLSVPRGTGALSRQARRIAAYARRNVSLCVADTLVIGGMPSCLKGWSAHCRVNCLPHTGESGNKLYTIREIASKMEISRFLHDGELPKTLDFPDGMCIIDG